MAIYDLSLAATPITNVNITEDVRGNLTPVTGSPFTVTTTAAIVLPANPSRASASIFNSGTTTVFLREGTTPAVTATNYNYPLPPNRLWEPDANFRFLGGIQAITAAGAATLQVSESVVII
ncbi:hypothetical protein [Microcoleus sp. Pol10D4]|uniref:hypothetical protein n=1 Tax=Microcoleus sp. Pol10D4 TaxID=3055387 RepID=UPI002FD5FF5B